MLLTWLAAGEWTFTCLSAGDITKGELTAGGGTRTLTLLPGRDFESRASANSATPAKDAE
jgi:hypothetical protein